MHRLDSPKALAALLALLALWLLACVAVFHAKSDFAFGFMYFALPVSALLVPLAVGRVAFKLNRDVGASVETSPGYWEVAAFILAALAYVVCGFVLNRLLEIPWRQAKFGDPVLSLGHSAALFFALVALTLGSAAWLVLHKAPARSRAAAFCSAALAMLGFACVAYAAVGASPFALWRT
ncbi:MAG: hypothetical protein CFE41_22150 [Burkholderiales bacterium PBB2]|nr:MAG: hypothetical protein CFE41_22150 [Burkholderiales bacterium PBB2]